MQFQKVMLTYVTKADVLIYFSICYNSPSFILQYENYGKRSPPNSPLTVTSLATAEYLSLFVGQNKTKYDGAYDRESSTKENSASLSSPLGGDGKEIRQLIKVNKISLSFSYCFTIR